MPFEIPDGWCWTTIEDVCSKFSTGPFGSMVHKTDYVANDGVPMVNPANIVNSNVSNKYLVLVSVDKAKDLRKYRLEEGDVVIARRGDLSKCAVINKKQQGFLCGTGSFSLHLIYILPEYFQLVYLSPYVQSILNTECVGATMNNLNQGVLGAVLFPLPPLNEQYKILLELEKHFSFIDLLESKSSNLYETIKQTKSKILDLAIHGKLVPQNPMDEPAHELLKRINLKAEIISDNGHYQKLPEGWCETQLGDIFNHNTGKALNSSNTEGTLKDYLTTSNVYWNSFDFSVIKKMLFKESELNKCQITKGDLLVCEGGDIGRAAIWDYDYDICIQNHLHRLRPKVNGICVPFYYYVLYYLKINNMIGGKGIGLLGLSSNALHKLHVHFPPLNEQHRIVAKIEEIFTQLDAIEASL